MLKLAYETFVSHFLQLVERGLVPDAILRMGIRHLLSQRATGAEKLTLEELTDKKLAFVKELKSMPVAINTDNANEQHYEVPTDYFLLCLGKHLKYSSCLYNSPNEPLEVAEERMLALYTQRAQIEDGMSILELGCGWGSLSLFLAAAYPKSKVTAISNSRTQKEFIDERAKERGLNNLTIITANLVDFQAPSTYDRIISIECFEHMKNYEVLLSRVSSWLKDNGKLFLHIFVHKSLPYHYEVESEADWMTKYFFSGGTMPSFDLLLYFQQKLSIEKQWYVNGAHYSKTLEAWLKRQDANHQKVMKLFETTYGGYDQAVIWTNRWRVFYIACSELFNYRGGEEWGVGHYLFTKKS